VKLNEFKKRKQVNEIDSRSLFGDYGSAALRTGLGSMAGKNVLSTTDQMAKDDFITKFTSRALSGLQSAINGGLVDPNAAGQTTQTSQQGTQPTGQTTQPTQQDTQVNPADAIAQKRIAAQKAQAAAIREPGADEGPKYNIDPNKQMQPKVAGSTTMTPKASTVATDAPKTPEQIRQEKLAAASQAAQGQMTPKASTVATDAPKTPEQIRQEKLAAASQAAQGQMNPVSNLPADQFAKSASNVRKQQQGVATQNAQDQTLPMSKLPPDQFNKSAANVRKSKQATAMKPVRKPKDNSIKFPKKNKPIPTPPAGNQAFGQMAQNLSRVAEGNRFDKLNYIFESILAEQDPESVATKQTISQYITNFFKQFMKNVVISDPTVMTNVSSLAKELEQTYAKDKGRTTLPKLANLAYAVSYAEQKNNDEKKSTTPSIEKSTSDATTTTTNPAPTQNTQAASPVVAKSANDIKKLMKNFTTQQKKSVLQTLTRDLSIELAKKEPKVTVGKQKRSTKAIDPVDAQLLAAAKKQGKI